MDRNESEYRGLSNLSHSLQPRSPISSGPRSPDLHDDHLIMFSEKELTQEREQSPAAVFGGANRLSVSTNVVRQMRKAFFSSNRAETRARRSGTRFGTRFHGDEDEDDDIDGNVENDNDHTDDWAKSKYGFSQNIDGRGKRFPESPIDHYEDEAYGAKFDAKLVDMGDSERGKKSFSAYSTNNATGFTTLWTSAHQSPGPTPEKLPRVIGIGKSEPSKWEEPELDDWTELSSQAAPRTPFRPILFEEPCEGVPITSVGQSGPPLLSELRLARFPAQLKGVILDRPSDVYYTNPHLYPYTSLNKLVKQSPLDQLRSGLSHRHLDAGLFHGHGMRPSWTLLRDGELHTMALVTSNDTDSRETAFSIQLSPSPAVLEDEMLLNAALQTSDRTSQLSDITQDSKQLTLQGQLFQPSTDHCPLWKPHSGLAPLEAYAQALQCDVSVLVSSDQPSSEVPDIRVVRMRRLIGLCLALWGRNPQETIATAFSRKQKHQSMHEVDPTDQPDQIEDSDNRGSESQSETDLSPMLPVDTPLFKRSDENGTLSYPDAILWMARKQAVSEWIRVQSFPWLRARLRQLNLWHLVFPDSGSKTGAETSTGDFPVSKVQHVNTETVGQGIFACLLSGEPGAACRIALGSSMSGLASLIAQSTAGDAVVRRRLQRQLDLWHELKYDKHIPLTILRIYALLAGYSEFPHPKWAKPVVVLANVDWIRVLGAYIWYLEDYTLDLADVLRAYSMAWHNSDPPSDRVLTRPVPPDDADLDLSNPPEFPHSPCDFPEFAAHSGANERHSLARSWPRDTAYHLLQLFCKRTHRLERTLDPCGVHRTTTKENGRSPTCRVNPANLIDWSPTWMLWRVLYALGYRHFERDYTESHICSEFAAQLESVGLWEWAVFVSLHEPNQMSRDMAVKAILARHVSLVIPPGLVALLQQHLNGITDPQAASTMPDDVNALLDQLVLSPPSPLTRAEHFVVEKLGVPLRWIHQAKAVLARHRFVACNKPVTLSHLGARVSSQIRKWNFSARLFATLEASHWLAAGHTAAAHSVCMDYLLPELVLYADTSRSLTTEPGLPWSMCRLGHHLARLLQPFDALPPTKLPENFAHGVGPYLMYSDILSLTELIARLCRTQTGPSYSRHRSTDQEEIDGTGQAQSQLATTLSTLRTQLTTFTEQLQYMITPNLKAKVVRTEMATVCAYVISAFLVANISEREDRSTGKNQTDLLDDLQHQLIAMAKVGLPADYHLREQSILAEARLSIGVT